jgi:hypothetical protein
MTRPVPIAWGDTMPPPRCPGTLGRRGFLHVGLALADPLPLGPQAPGGTGRPADEPSL